MHTAFSCRQTVRKYFFVPVRDAWWRNIWMFFSSEVARPDAMARGSEVAVIIKSPCRRARAWRVV
jgi:hypothetical protein